MNKTIILGVAIVLVGGVSFYGGMKYASANNSQYRNLAAVGQAGQFRTGQGASGARRPGMIGGTAGEIIAKDDTGLTVKLSDGGSRIVLVSASTTVSRITPGSLNDLTKGLSITVQGNANTDGSVNARNILIGSLMPVSAERKF